jgi:hypothetical protein
MTKQPLLTADEVIELLKEALPKDEVWHATFNELVEETKLASGVFDDPYTTIPLLEYCVNFLRNNGIHVYFDLSGGINHFTLITGECGRVYEEMCKLEDYLIDLSTFICSNKEILPPEIVAEEKRLDEYQNRLCDEVIFPIEIAYYDGDKAEIKAVLEKAQKLAKEIEAYLDSIKDLCRAHALATEW